MSTAYFYVDLPDRLEGGLIDATGGSRAGAVQETGQTPQGMTLMGGAAAAAGLMGTLLAGPLIGLGLAGGAAYAATRSDEVGDAARATGSAAITAGNAAYKAGKQAASHVSEMDKKYNLSGQMAAGLTQAANSIERAIQSGSSSSRNANQGR